MYNLSSKTALVTGAGGERGIGRAVATRLAREGADVIVSDLVENPYPGDSTEWVGLPSVVREIEAAGGNAEAILADVSKSDQVENLVGRGIDRFGHVDILVNAAGSLPGKDRVLVVDMEEEAWDKEMSVNARGVFLMCRAVARHMIERGKGGKIISIASTSGKIGRPRFSAYCASKAAIIRFTQGPGAGTRPPRNQRELRVAHCRRYGTGRIHRRGRVVRDHPREILEGQRSPRTVHS